MALGTTATVLLGLAGAGAGLGASKLMAPKQQASAPIPLPQPPVQVDAVAKAADTVKSKRAAVTQSVYTSPLGIGGMADVNKKTLLGQ